jgi:hypothetical protein
MSPRAIRTAFWLSVVLSTACALASDTTVKNTGGPSTADQKDSSAAKVPSPPEPGTPVSNESGASKSSQGAADKASRKPALVIEESTTHILKPLRPDGYPDYFGAINDYCRGSATPLSNAAVPMIQAFGPATAPITIRDDYFRLLGIDSLPSVGNYFVHSQEMLDRWVRAAPDAPTAKLADTLQEQFAFAGDSPWSSDDYPMIAEWLLINEEPLRLICEASKRSDFYEPILSQNHSLPALCAVASPLESILGEITLALQARAMLHARSGDFESAISDLIACHRCLRLMSHVPLGQYAVETRTAEIALRQTELKLIHYCRPSAKQLQILASQLSQLPPLLSLADRIDLGDRFRYLDAVCVLQRNGPAAVQQLFGETSLSADESSLQKAVSDLMFDWNEPLRMGNQWFDKEIAIYRMTDRVRREEALEKLHTELEQMVADSSRPAIFVLNWFTRQSVKAAMGRVVGATLLQLFDTEVPGILNIADQLEVRSTFTQTGIALAAYRAEHGQYPERLEQLPSKDSTSDLFRENSPLGYRRLPTGYLLYSVGPNGRDEQGGLSDKYPDSDDISIIVTDPVPTPARIGR